MLDRPLPGVEDYLIAIRLDTEINFRRCDVHNRALEPLLKLDSEGNGSRDSEAMHAFKLVAQATPPGTEYWENDITTHISANRLSPVCGVVVANPFLRPTSKSAGRAQFFRFDQMKLMNNQIATTGHGKGCMSRSKRY